ncbi:MULTISPECIES: GH12 family glycosyl hydrolase domain-containing protein [Curtobacterium]|uniref:Uncharacterized protein n=2 Tax=Curtobacterium TaxID=2034 RepID=A0A5P8YVP1_9MICO|nr:hypothetical protein [Curtobacterium flaccumfaciens]MBO9041501.1 hypothetical protein [Curtobacterium flaccumfaciens pv. flaccumfaciens]MBO9044987.1 hypothetical protein [Curtobacterium flaccumfaciens pv. flaccumfaciens]MBO9048871.1 hypothetical protein [Curtobacterium flaccumfaciens pv. flaccumfaciens]MBO9057721.1 hypothetical protein [Curtobacterium flaccumfaciens pv. flaccumfaciens]MBT1543160.1 hypothetical protein [Curtobacterium flaccumfaciens pv. flaccumfaciens]
MRLTKIPVVLLALASAVSLISGATAASSSPNAKIPIFDKDSYLFNNKWGGNSGLQTIRDQNGEGHLEWAWGNSATSVQGYPSVVRGWHWDTPGFKTHTLPIAVTSPKACSLRSTLKYKLKASGAYDAAYDLWTATGRNLSWQTKPSLEVMVWGEHERVNPAGSPTGTATIGGHNWTVWRGTGPFGGPVVSFVAGSGALHGSLNLMQFVRTAAGPDADPNLRLISTEFGVEVTQGSGSATVQKWTQQRSRSCK